MKVLHPPLCVTR